MQLELQEDFDGQNEEEDEEEGNEDENDADEDDDIDENLFFGIPDQASPELATCTHCKGSDVSCLFNLIYVSSFLTHCVFIYTNIQLVITRPTKKSFQATIFRVCFGLLFKISGR